jgi:hypothetical protein
MATLSELVETIARVEGLDSSAVNLVARYVREAGLITTGGRGSSAATMFVTDAANLLIAVNATTAAVDAAKITRTYRALEAYEPRNEADPRPPNKYGTLGEAVEQLFEATITAQPLEIFLGQELPVELHDAFLTGQAEIELKFARPIPSATLHVTCLPTEEEMSPTLARYFSDTGVTPQVFFRFEAQKGRGSPKPKKLGTADRTEATTIGFRTVQAVAQLLSRVGHKR